MGDFSAKRHLFLWHYSKRYLTYLSENGNSNKSKVVYTRPIIKADHLLADTINEASIKILDRPIVRPTVSDDLEGVLELIKGSYMRAASNLTLTLLTKLSKGENARQNSFESLELWSIRFQLLMGLKLYDMLINELESFDELDAPDLYCQFYDKFDGDKYKDCTIVPFSLRLIHAEALRFSSTPWNCIPRIERLESNIELLICKMIKETMPAIQIEDWKKRLECVHLMKARTLYFLKQTTQSSSLYNKIVNETKDDKFKRQLLEMLTRLSISCGDEQAMEKFFKELNSQSNVNQYYFHKCLRAVFHGNYLNAQEQLQNLVHIDVTEPSFVNNLAVAHLYNGNPNEGNELLKKYKEIPPEVIFTNVYTLSELITDKAVYIQNKMFAKFADKLGDGSNAKDIKILYD